jgi:transcription antitermination factor NusG
MTGSYGSPEVVPAYGRSSSQAAIGLPRKQWFAVETRYRFEKKVVSQLDNKGFDVFLPLLTEHHTWSDRKKVVTTPLFPGYAFVSLDQSNDARRLVLQTVGMIGFVSFGGIIAEVPCQEIESLKLLLQGNVPFAMHPFVHVGQQVRIRGGCLNGLEGILLQDKGKLVVSIQSIQRSVAIEMEGYELSPVVA